METLKFKTNIKCSGCVDIVTPFLNDEAGKDNWQVDTSNPDKVLTVSTREAIPAKEIIASVEKAGYKAVLID